MSQQTKVLLDNAFIGPMPDTFLTLSWRRSISHRKPSIDLRCKSRDWFLYDSDLRHERFNDLEEYKAAINKKNLLDRRYDEPLSTYSRFVGKEIWRTSIHLFKVRWNDRLVDYFPPMCRYRINTNILHVIFSCVEFWSLCTKC